MDGTELGSKWHVPTPRGRHCGRSLTTRRWGRVVVAVSFLTFLLHVGTIGTFGAYIPMLLKEFENGSGQLGWVVSSGVAVENFAGPLANVVVRKIGYRPAVMLGGALMACGTVTASFATSVYHLFACIGLIAGLGGSITHVAIIVAVGEFYTRHYTVANGVAYAGPGAGVFVFPPIIQYLSENYGWRGSLIIEAAIVSHVTVLGALFRPASLFKSPARRSRDYMDDEDDDVNDDGTREHLRYETVDAKGTVDGRVGRVDEDKSSDSGISVVSYETEEERVHRDYSIKHAVGDGAPRCRSPTGWGMRTRRKSIFTQTFTPAILAVFAACVFHTAGYSGVTVHVVNQAVSDGLSHGQASILFSCIGIGSLVGRLSHGWFLARRLITASSMYTLSLLVSVGATTVLTLTTNFWGKAACATTVGICSGVYFSLVAVILRELVGLLYLGVAFGVSLFCSGVGTTLGGYVIGVLRDVTGSYDVPSYFISGFFALAAASSMLRPACLWYQARSRKQHVMPRHKASPTAV